MLNKNQSICVDCGNIFDSINIIKEETDPGSIRKIGEAPLYGTCQKCTLNPNSPKIETNCTSPRTPLLQEEFY